MGSYARDWSHPDLQKCFNYWWCSQHTSAEQTPALSNWISLANKHSDTETWSLGVLPTNETSSMNSEHKLQEIIALTNFPLLFDESGHIMQKKTSQEFYL